MVCNLGVCSSRWFTQPWLGHWTMGPVLVIGSLNQSRQGPGWIYGFVHRVLPLRGINMRSSDRGPIRLARLELNTDVTLTGFTFHVCMIALYQANQQPLSKAALQL